MSLIGPRPLLPHDQPPDSAQRLTVRPGITGWAQVCGGNLLSPQEKGDHDAWYIRNATLALDLRIFARTLWFLFAGERRVGEPLGRAPASVNASIGRRASRGAAHSS
jgi:lipopolysaccharide/colanic/teichoic acid biosynthesis glycosyltransferase